MPNRIVLTPISRTWIVPPAGGPNWWPNCLPTSDLDYTMDVSAIVDGVDQIATVSLAILPGGEMQCYRLGVDGCKIIAELAGGVACRVYTVAVTITGATGRVWPLIVGIICTSPGPFERPEPPVNPGYGITVMWPCGTTSFGPAQTLPDFTVGATGTTPGTAAVVPYLANTLINSGPGGAVIIGVPASSWNGVRPIFTNMSGGNVTVYLYSGDLYYNQSVGYGVTLVNTQSMTLSVSQIGAVVVQN